MNVWWNWTRMSKDGSRAWGTQHNSDSKSFRWSPISDMVVRDWRRYAILDLPNLVIAVDPSNGEYLFFMKEVP